MGRVENGTSCEQNELRMGQVANGTSCELDELRMGRVVNGRSCESNDFRMCDEMPMKRPASDPCLLLTYTYSYVLKEDG